MDIKVKEFLHETLLELETKHGFTISEESEDKSTYVIHYKSPVLTLELTAYHHEFSATLWKSEIDEGVNLFNLLDYLRRDVSNIEAPSLTERQDLSERYKAQLSYLANIIFGNIDIIFRFFCRPDIKAEFSAITKFVIDKYPHLFKN